MAVAELTEHERAYFKKMFDLYDTDKSGAIGLSELRNLSKHLGVEMSEQHILASVRSIGVHADGEDIDLAFPQFVMWLHNASSAGDEFALLKAKITAKGNKALNNEQIARLKEVFDHFDADGSGSIDAGELRNVFQSMGTEVSEQEMEDMIAGVDDDGSGQIEFQEFMVLMCSNFGSRSFEEDMREAFTQLDPDSTGKLDVKKLKSMMKELTGGLLSDQEIADIITSIDGSGPVDDVEYMKWESLWEACREDMG
jgi:calcium-binding protein CML